jgi:hypothetical protein
MSTSVDTSAALIGSETDRGIALSRESALVGRYGELLRPSELAFELKYPSAGALLKSHERGRLPIPLIRVPGRRGLFASTRALARLINDCENQSIQGDTT